jgi:hypothetical protein
MLLENEEVIYEYYKHLQHMRELLLKKAISLEIAMPILEEITHSLHRFGNFNRNDLLIIESSEFTKIGLIIADNDEERIIFNYTQQIPDEHTENDISSDLLRSSDISEYEEYLINSKDLEYDNFLLSQYKMEYETEPMLEDEHTYLINLQFKLDQMSRKREASKNLRNLKKVLQETKVKDQDNTDKICDSNMHTSLLIKEENMEQTPNIIEHQTSTSDQNNMIYLLDQIIQENEYKNDFNISKELNTQIKNHNFIENQDIDDFNLDLDKFAWYITHDDPGQSSVQGWESLSDFATSPPPVKKFKLDEEPQKIQENMMSNLGLIKTLTNKPTTAKYE